MPPQAAVTAQQAANATPRFVAVPLPRDFVPHAIMRDGQIPGSFGRNAAIYAHGSVRDLGSLPGSDSSAALWANSRGEAAGISFFSPPHPVPLAATLFSGGSVRNLSSQAPAHQAESVDVIGNREQLYGTSDPEDWLDTLDLVLFSPTGGHVHLNAVNGQRAAGFISDINNSGHVAGYELASFGGFDNVGSQAAIGFDLSLTPLNLNVFTSVATAINDSEDVAGYVDPSNSQVETSGTWTGFVRSRNATKFLPFLPGSTQMKPSGINDRGDVVGTSTGQFGADFTVFVYTHGVVFDALKRTTPALNATQLLHGLSNQGAFVVQTEAGYYLVQPTH